MEPEEIMEKLVRALEGLGVPYLITGSVASIAYGEPRLTNDLDVVADLKPAHLRRFLAEFPGEEFYVSPEAASEAVAARDQFNVIHGASGFKIDVILRKDTPFDESRFGRARRLSPREGLEAQFAAPEDVIIKKLEYFRMGGSDKHLRDIAGILRVSSDQVDRGYIETWALRLGLTDIWSAVTEREKKD